MKSLLLLLLLLLLLPPPPPHAGCPMSLFVTSMSLRCHKNASCGACESRRYFPE
jgi:hypothetical protein